MDTRNPTEYENTMPIDLDSIQRVAALEVQGFIKRAAWSAHHAADMQQEVILALLTSKGFDESKGSWKCWAAGAAQHVIVRYLKRARVWRSRGQMETLGAEHDGVLDPAPLPDARVEDARVAKRVRRLLRRLDYSPKKVGLAAALGAPSREVARKARVPVEAVYYARAQMVRRAALSTPLKQLWKELRP